MNLLSLFSGIGGLDLGLERAGMRVIGQVERDEYCLSVLARHWPDVPRHSDADTADVWWKSEPRPPVDVLAGGFPCQPFSVAGQQKGVSDERWGWPAFADVVRVVRPRYVLVENVPGLLADTRAFGTILADLAAFGFDASWSVLSACAMGAPHTRDRLFLVAYPHGLDGFPRLVSRKTGETAPLPPRRSAASAWPHPVDGVVEAARRSHRVPNGSTRRMVTAGGNAVVPAVAEHIGHLIVDHAAAVA